MRPLIPLRLPKPVIGARLSSCLPPPPTPLALHRPRPTGERQLHQQPVRQHKLLEDWARQELLQQLQEQEEGLPPPPPPSTQQQQQLWLSPQPQTLPLRLPPPPPRPSLLPPMPPLSPHHPFWTCLLIPPPRYPHLLAPFLLPLSSPSRACHLPCLSTSLVVARLANSSLTRDHSLVFLDRCELSEILQVAAQQLNVDILEYF